MTVTLSLTVNGKAVQASVDPRTLLVEFIREQLRLTGTHVGCDTAQCGACTVHMNGRAVKACSMLAVQAQGAQITTIEGLNQDGALHPMQAAFHECHGLQCGFCTPGMVMSAVQLLADNPKAAQALADGYFDALAMIKAEPKKSFEIMGADVKQSGEQFERSQGFLRWQDRDANLKFFTGGEFAEFNKMAADLLLQAGVIKAIPDLGKLADTRFLK